MAELTILASALAAAAGGDLLTSALRDLVVSHPLGVGVAGVALGCCVASVFPARAGAQARPSLPAERESTPPSVAGFANQGLASPEPALLDVRAPGGGE